MDIREVHFWTVKHSTVILEIKKKQKQKQKTKKQKNTDFFQNTCFKESKILTVEKNLRVTKNFSKILCLPVIAWSKTHLSKHGCISSIDIGEIFFCSCYFWRLVSRFFSSRVTNLQCNLVCARYFTAAEAYRNVQRNTCEIIFGASLDWWFQYLR